MTSLPVFRLKRFRLSLASITPGATSIARMTGLACVLGGGVGIAEHAAGPGALRPGTGLLHPLAAVCFALFGIYLLLAAQPRPPRRLLYAFGVTLKAVCASAILAQLFGWTLPYSSPLAAGGSTDLVMTFAFGCAALAVILSQGPHLRTHNWMFVPLLPVFWASYISLAANFYQVEYLNSYFAQTLLPLPAAVLFSALTIGFLATQPRNGFMMALDRRYLGGILASVAFPAILITPFTIGWVRIRALKAGDYDMAAAFAQFATTNIVIFGSFIWLCAHMLNRIDARRQKTMDSLQSANAELHRVNAALELKIDEQIRTEAARQKTELELFQSQKMEAMGTLAAGIAHDFNNLLTVIMLNAENALEAAPQDSPLRGPLGEIRKSGTRAAEVVRQIMTFGRKSPVGRGDVCLREIIAETSELLRHGLPRHVTMRTSLPEDIPLIRADSTQIQQVLLNLGTNAAQAMAESGGLLEFIGDRVTFREGDPRPHSDLHGADYVRLTVKDEGCGMNEETLKRVFDPFFTTKPPGKGTGLGLSVVHGIMQLHQGCVTVRSAPGRGSAFSLYFPVTNAA